MQALLPGTFRNVLLQCPPQNSCHSHILEQEMNELRFYFTHSRPVPHASSPARWVLTAPIQPHHSGEMPGAGASSGWLLIQMGIPQLGLETALDYRALPLLHKYSCYSKHEPAIRMNGMEGILKGNRRVGKEFDITKGKYSLILLSLSSSGKYPRIALIW